MELPDSLDILGVHAEGEIGRVLFAGAPAIPGKTLREKMTYLNEVDNSFLRFCLSEPRASSNMTVNLIVEPVAPEADIAFIPMQPDGAHAISGSNCICVATAALETGRVKMTEPFSHVTLETPAGLVTARAECRSGKCERVTVRMAPSFVERLDVALEVPGIGSVSVDVAFGGCYFVLVDADKLGILLDRAQARKLVEIAAAFKRAANEQFRPMPRGDIDISRIEYVLFTSARDGKLTNVNIIHPGRADRSPCGTGSGARLATMFARGQCTLDKPVTFHSLIGGQFECRIVDSAALDDRHAITHEISGRAWSYSHERHWLSPSDPYPTGYTLADTWGPDAD